MEKLRIVFLGGQDEFYKACTVIEINDDIFVVECGMKYPDITKPGIDYVIARNDYLVENKNRVKAYFLTYGHDSVIAGLPYIIENVPAPVYCSDITKAFLEMFCEHNHLRIDNIDFHIVKPSSDLEVSGHKISLFSTCTNIANSFGIVFDTEQGNLVYLANSVFDNNNDKGFSNDISQAAKLVSQKPTLALLMDSRYATRQGYTNPHYRAIPLIKRSMLTAQGRLFIAAEAPDIYNIIAICHEAIKNGRKLVFYDQATKDLADVLIKTGCLQIAKTNILSLEEINRIRAQEILVLITGFGSKLFHKISLLATHQNDEQLLKLNSSDTFIIAAHPENETEISQTNALNELYKNDCSILSLSGKTFIKMHSSEEDIKTAISVFKPKYYIPITGTFVQLLANAKIALGMNMGLNHNNVFILDNGNIVEFENYFAKILPTKIITGNLYIDGKGVGDIAGDVLEERQRFSDDGVIIVATTISKSNREIVLGPDIQTRGLVFVKESESLMKEIEKVLRTNINLELSKPNYSVSYMEITIKEQIFKTVRRATLKSPTIIPIIVEID